MVLNETLTYTLQTAHSQVAIPALIILYIAMLLMFLIVGLALVKNSKSKFMTIWGLSAIFGGLILLGLILMPNFTQSIVNFFATNLK